MAGRETADIVFCMDASGSMEPSFRGVRDHVLDLLQSIREDLQRSWDIRFDFLAYKQSYEVDGKAAMSFQSVNKSNKTLLDAIYNSAYDPNGGSSSGLFTSDVEAFRSAVGAVDCEGEEASAVALDIASDFPFRAAETCHRVIILLTDEPLETGSCKRGSMENWDALLQKLQRKGILLYAVTPAGPAYDSLSSMDKCDWTEVGDQGRGLSNVDFKKLLEAIGKSVSASQTERAGTGAPQPVFNVTSWREAEDCVVTDLEP